MASQIVRFDTLRSVAFGSITGSFAALGSAFSHNVRVLKIQNTTDADISISFDGTNTNDYIPAGGFSLYDMTTNREGQNLANTFVFSINTQIYLKTDGSPTRGVVTATCVYGQGE